MGTSSDLRTDLDREEIIASIRKDGYDLTNPADAVTCAAWFVGPDIKRIASFLGRPRSWVAPVARRLRSQGIWRGNKVLVSSDGELGIELALQTLVARGLLNGTPRGGFRDPTH